MRIFTKQTGFTVLELLVVVAIVGVLVLVSTNVYSGYQVRTRDTTRENNIKIIVAALERYHTTNGEYPNVGTMIGPSDNLAELLKIEEKLLVSPNAPSGTTNSFVDFATAPDSTTTDVYRYEGIDPDTSSDCNYTSIEWARKQGPQIPVVTLASDVKLAVIVSDKKCESFKISYKNETTGTWKYINSINN
ncbi:MAG TPA: prepilin-type N-terminal cleavage/methylation domain-containing protein [Candidatus Saccharimonadales bacterium]